MQTVSTVGLDIAKSVFQVHGVDNHGKVVIRRQLKRRYVLAFFEKLQPCLVGIEARASSHHWSGELQALGHTVRLMPPAYVKLTSNGRRTMRPTPRPSVRRLQEPICGLCQSRRLRTKRADAPSHAPSVHPPADLGDQCDPGSPCVCPLKMQCCPNMIARQVPRDVHEDARDFARRLMEQSASSSHATNASASRCVSPISRPSRIRTHETSRAFGCARRIPSRRHRTKSKTLALRVLRPPHLPGVA